MSTLTDLIAYGGQKVIRRCYVKRRETGDTIESSWARVDNYNGRDRVLNWGSVTLDCDTKPGQPGNFTISNCSLTFDNTSGFWNIETDLNSYWNGYLTRKYSLIKITSCYVDNDGTETSEVTEFEGVISKVRTTEQEKAFVSSTSYGSILQAYDISDLSLSGEDTIDNTVTDILNQAKIAKFFSSYSVNASNNIDISTGDLTGTYWEVLRKLAFLSSSVIVIAGDTIDFKARTIGGVSVWNFRGAGCPGENDIYQVTQYDPEGADDVRLTWASKDGATTATSTNATYLAKYLGAPQQIDLDLVASADKASCLSAQLTRWETPKPKIEFTTKFLSDQIALLDRINIRIYGRLYPRDGTGAYYDQASYGDGPVYFGEAGGVKVSGDWGVVRIKKDFQSWKYTIKAEKVV